MHVLNSSVLKDEESFIPSESQRHKKKVCVLHPSPFSSIFQCLLFSKSICLRDKWPLCCRGWQPTQRWYWIDFRNVAELTVWCILLNINHKILLKNPWMADTRILFVMINLTQSLQWESSQSGSNKIAFHSPLDFPGIFLFRLALCRTLIGLTVLALRQAHTNVASLLPICWARSFCCEIRCLNFFLD